MNTITPVILTPQPKGEKPVSYADILKAVRKVNARYSNFTLKSATVTSPPVTKSRRTKAKTSNK